MSPPPGKIWILRVLRCDFLASGGKAFCLTSSFLASYKIWSLKTFLTPGSGGAIAPLPPPLATPLVWAFCSSSWCPRHHKYQEVVSDHGKCAVVAMPGDFHQRLPKMLQPSWPSSLAVSPTEMFAWTILFPQLTDPFGTVIMAPQSYGCFVKYENFLTVGLRYRSGYRKGYGPFVNKVPDKAS